MKKSMHFQIQSIYLNLKKVLAYFKRTFLKSKACRLIRFQFSMNDIFPIAL